MLPILALSVQIKVRLPNGRVVIGWLHHYDFKYDLAVVNIRRARGFQEAHLCSSHSMQFESNSKVVAVGRCFDSGMLKFTNGTVIRPTSDALSELVISTCKMNMVSRCFFL
jgi:S1-C subfamily serine protease